jgi:hypothetical protein
MSTTETLGQKQERFAILLARWIERIYEMGYRVRLGEVARTDEQSELNAIGAAGRHSVAQLLRPHWPVLANAIDNNTGNGIRGSLHTLKLAADINLFVEGRWISDGADVHWKRVGELWEGMGDGCCWGGRFGDANHLSITHEGRK